MKKKKVNHANDRVIYLGMELSRAEAERTKKFCDDAAYTAKEGVAARGVVIGAATIYFSGLGAVLTVGRAVIATTSTIAHGANVQEQVSGNNFLKDLVFDGDQKSYEKFQMGLALAEGAVAIAAISAQAKSNLKTKIKAKKKGNKGVGNPVKVLGRGSTGRTIPNNLKEQMAMHQVKSNPLKGASDLSKSSKPIIMTDPRWPASEGWVKMSNNANGVEIHFVYNKKMGAFDDFKFK